MSEGLCACAMNDGDGIVVVCFAVRSCISAYLSKCVRQNKNKTSGKVEKEPLATKCQEKQCFGSFYPEFWITRDAVRCYRETLHCLSVIISMHGTRGCETALLADHEGQ